MDAEKQVFSGKWRAALRQRLRSILGEPGKMLLQGERGAEIAGRRYGWAEGCKQAQGLSPPRFMAYGNAGVVHAPSRASCPTPVLPAPMLRGQAGLRARAMQSHQHECCTVRVTASCLLAFIIQLVLMLNLF